MTNSETYEDRFGPVMRQAHRAARRLRWAAKGAVGIPRRILVETRWRLGDEVMAIPIYEALRVRYPHVHVSVWCNYPELLDENPFVDKVIGPGDAELQRSPDQYILLRGAARDAYRLDEYAKRARVPTPRTRPRLCYHDWSTALLDRQFPETANPLVAVCAGASWPTKRWPLERWRALARALEDAGYAIVELGQGNERIGAGTCLVDKTTVREAACILHAARLFIGCDSGLMHLALAAGSKALALFGPTDPSILIREEPNLSAITNERECHGCWNRPGRFAEAGLPTAVPPGTCPCAIATCLDLITVEAVLQRAHGILAISATHLTPGGSAGLQHA